MLRASLPQLTEALNAPQEWPFMFTSSPVHYLRSQLPSRKCATFVSRYSERVTRTARQIAYGACAFLGLARISHAEVMKGASMLCGEEKQVPVNVFASSNAEELVRLNVVADEKHALPANGGWSLHFSGVSSGTL